MQTNSPENSLSLNTTDAKSLMETNLVPTRHIVEGLIPQGLHILAGAPKVGKSYLTLWLCAQIARGQPVWDFPSHCCDVLYIALEDTPGRIKKRLSEIADEFPENMHLAITARTLENGLSEQLEAFLKEYPNTGFIAIDTLQKVRSLGSGQGTYAADYNALASLKEIADRHKIAILLIHPLRKTKASDPFSQISGTTGITGAADTSYVLKPNAGRERTARLFVTGRDVAYQELDLCFTNGIWRLVERRTREELEDDDGVLDFISRVVGLVYQCDGWKGTAAKLLFYTEEKNISANYVTRTLKDEADSLDQFGISMRLSRSNGIRFIHLDLDKAKQEIYLRREEAARDTLRQALKDGFDLAEEEMRIIGDASPEKQKLYLLPPAGVPEQA